VLKLISQKKMESLYKLPYKVLLCPNIKIKKPTWFHKPSPMFVFSCVMASYFLVTAGEFLSKFVRDWSVFGQATVLRSMNLQ